MTLRASSGADALPRTISLVDVEPAAAAAEIASFANGIGPALILLFGSPAEQLGPVAKALRPHLDNAVMLAGCSTAGELVDAGYSKGGLLAVVFPSAGFRVRVVVLRDLARNEVTRWMAELRAQRAALAGDGAHHLGLVVADGCSRQQDVLAATLEAARGSFQVLGGFGGNDLDFADVVVIHDDEVLQDAAVVCLLATDLPVKEVVFAHFTPTGRRGVVTAADVETQTVLELNAEPAAREYARLAGLDAANLTPLDFASHPLLLRAGNRNYVRAISGVHENGGLQLLASVDVGTVLTLGRAENLIEGFDDCLAQLPRMPALILGFDCFLRRLVLEKPALHARLAELHRRYNIWGINTYGELHDGMHVNQTFVGIAFLLPECSSE